jgi:ParB-like chromosome segregation protein Spo0J
MQGAHQIEKIGIEKLIPYAKNSRTHSDEQVAQIAASIKEFGFNNPVLIGEDDVIIAGHGRVMAARKIGLMEVPCIRLGHLTETQRKAYIIADNRLALNAGWDNEMLKIELLELDGNINLDILGFTTPELTIAMGFGADFEPGTEDDQGQLDQKDPIICPACSHEFHK